MFQIPKTLLHHKCLVFFKFHNCLWEQGNCFVKSRRSDHRSSKLVLKSWFSQKCGEDGIHGLCLIFLPFSELLFLRLREKVSIDHSIDFAGLGECGEPVLVEREFESGNLGFLIRHLKYFIFHSLVAWSAHSSSPNHLNLGFSLIFQNCSPPLKYYSHTHVSANTSKTKLKSHLPSRISSESECSWARELAPSDLKMFLVIFLHWVGNSYILCTHAV